MAICEDCGLPQENSSAEPGNRTLCIQCANLASEGRSVRITPLQREDLELVLAWRSNPEIYRYFRDQDEPLKWEKHVEWFKSRSNQRHDFIIHYEGRRVGVINLSADNEVGIFIGDFSARGNGVASVSLRWLCQQFQDRSPLFAEIHDDNNQSKYLFRTCGFSEQNKNTDWVDYRYDS